ncbi:MAG: ABC transporter ATP-binding protein [Clostridiales bacterium]
MENTDKYFILNGEQIKVLSNISLHVEKGERIAVLGPSGCGKSTILGLLAGFYKADKGNIHVEGKVSLMPQQDMLLPWRKILDNALLPLELRGEKSSLAYQKASELLPLFGLEGFGESYPNQLSGGMRQRASLLRTYLNGGDFWLLDEPFGKLDTLTKEELQLWLLDVWQTSQPGMVFVTHDIEEAIHLAHRIYLLSPRPGTIIHQFTVDWQKNDPQGEIKALNLKQRIRESLFLKNK